MSKRLQVILNDQVHREIQKAARSRGITVAAWVRQALEKARQNQPTGDVATKLAAIRAAARLDGPTADIDQMLAEIEQGYEGGPNP
ncbi:MAG TPA: CopG family transcriptional regulator [Verrucomicrobiae bacterium]|jgi:hypothetical protein|nr:CopG family transcriptional regulator [Verrucomicrobiae bacterium]